ncbi:MAG: ribonuclease III [Syntrophobacterales bacterium]|nr:MAG: ribonuclease III [Syntrophobacterales bacterium]
MIGVHGGMDSDRLEALSVLQGEISYQFNDPDLLNTALTHRSYANEMSGGSSQDNERLEFLGDSVLNVIISHVIMVRFPHCHEGEMTRLRASLVNEKSLAGISKKLGINQCLLLGKGEALKGGREKSSVISNAYEAIIGAIYLDGGFEKAFSVVEKQFSPLLHQGLSDDGDCKSKVQEICQSRFGSPPRYRVSELSGPDHDKTFGAEIFIEGRSYGYGIGKNKKEAQQNAAREALKTISGEQP